MVFLCGPLTGCSPLDTNSFYGKIFLLTRRGPFGMLAAGKFLSK